MVRGLARFREHFASYQDSYVLIGGAACAELMDESGLQFRGTRDLDIVLVVESLTVEFFAAFWDFVHKGRYQKRHESMGDKKYYRFERPEDQTYPEQMELFSRIPDCVSYEGSGNLTPIPVDDDLSSLSAILLDQNYYDLILEGRKDVGGLSCLKAEYIILLKARAWLDMAKRVEDGESIDSKKIKKHRYDVIRLFPLLAPDLRLSLPISVKHDLDKFIEGIEADSSINLRDFHLRQISMDEFVKRLRKIFDLDAEL